MLFEHLPTKLSDYQLNIDEFPTIAIITLTYKNKTFEAQITQNDLKSRSTNIKKICQIISTPKSQYKMYEIKIQHKNKYLIMDIKHNNNFIGFTETIFFKEKINNPAEYKQQIQINYERYIFIILLVFIISYCDMMYANTEKNISSKNFSSTSEIDKINEIYKLKQQNTLLQNENKENIKIINDIITNVDIITTDIFNENILLGVEYFDLGSHYSSLQNYEKMIKYYLMAIHKNNTFAMFNLGLYYNDSGDYEEMKYYYIMAIENGNTNSMNNLAIYYFNNKQYDKMKFYYMMAIKLNDTMAMNNLGYFYQYDKKDYEQMKKYYMMAIENNNTNSMINLALYYRDIEQNYDKMKYYFLMANSNKSVDIKSVDINDVLNDVLNDVNGKSTDIRKNRIKSTIYYKKYRDNLYKG